MKFKLVILAVTTLTLASSCSNVFIPALYHRDIAYQPKPTSFDTTKTATYVSAGLNRSLSVDARGLLTSGQANLSRGHRFGNFNIAYGAFGVLGNYKYSGNTTDKNYFSKFFGAIGGRFSANAFVTSNNMDYRFIGVEMAYSHEFGDYASYRLKLPQNSGYFVDPRTDLYSIGLTSERIFHGKNNIVFQYGMRGFFGTTLIHNSLNNSFNFNSYQTFLNPFWGYITLKASYFVTFKNFFGTAEIGSDLSLRFGYKF